MTTYPTQWTNEIPRGSIADKNTSYMLRISDGKKIHTTSYSINDFPSKEECLKHVEKERIKKSRELGLTRNEIRFINKNTIEIQLTKDKTFITDAKKLELVNKYPLQAKAKKEKSVTRYYVIAQDKKKTFKFTNLLNNYKFVEYINGNTLDLREKNMKEFGLEYKVAKKPSDIDNINIEDHSKYYEMPIDQLPKNKWILGSVPGTIFFREEEKDKVLTMRIIQDDGQVRCKTFNVDEYESVDEAIYVARKYMINIAHKMNIVKNKIRINDNFLEIMINDDKIVKMNLIFLPMFVTTIDKYRLNFSLCQTHASNSDKTYAVICYDRNIICLHKFIMGSAFIDHINGDPLDNRFENLRFSDAKHNATNRQSINDLAFGVKHGVDSNGEFYCAHMRNHKKIFYVKKYGVDAKKLAESYRKNIMEISFDPKDISTLPHDPNDLCIVKDSLSRTKDYQQDMSNRTVFDVNKYFFDLTCVDNQIKKNIHMCYLKLQSWRHTMLTIRIEKLGQVINKINYKKPIKIVEV
jgi:hypothetical protein